MKYQRCCYANNIAAFLSEEKGKWINQMRDSFEAMLEMPLGESQIRAWKDCFDVLKEQLPSVARVCPNFDIVFEYCLPYESGRRPDVLLVSKEQVIVLEFKQNFRVIHADIDQTAAYARDIREYHYESRNSKVSAILVLTHADENAADVDTTNGVAIAPRAALAYRQKG